MPKLPEGNNIISEEAVNLILIPIEMEKTWLRHTLNTEGEKLRYVLGKASLDEQTIAKDMMDVNKSVRKILSNATRLQMALYTKMKGAMSTSNIRGQPIHKILKVKWVLKANPDINKTRWDAVSTIIASITMDELSI